MTDQERYIIVADIRVMKTKRIRIIKLGCCDNPCFSFSSADFRFFMSGWGLGGDIFRDGSNSASRRLMTTILLLTCEESLRSRILRVFS